MCQNHEVRAYRFACGCCIWNLGEVLGIKYAHCENYDVYTNTLQFRDPNALHTARTCCLNDESGIEYLPNLACWAHAKLYRDRQPLALVKPTVYESPCDWANSGDFVIDDAFKRIRDHIYAQSDVKIMLELLGEAFRSSDPRGQWELVEREIEAAVQERDNFPATKGSQRSVVVAPKVLRPAVLEYL